MTLVAEILLAHFTLDATIKKAKFGLHAMEANLKKIKSTLLK